MERYQVYLNPTSVLILDDFEKSSKVSRSQLIREAIDRLADQLLKMTPVNPVGGKSYLLDKLAGLVDLGAEKKTNFARDVDSIYNQ